MANLKLTLLDVLIVKLRECCLSLIRGLEADESISLLFFIKREHFDALNLSVLSLEIMFHLLFGHLGIKVLNVQVASFLGVLVFDCLTNEFFLTIRGTESRFDIKLLSILHLFTVESINSCSGVFRSVLMVVLVFSHEADEGEVSNTFFLNLNETSYVSIGLEKTSDLIIRPFFRVVLYVKVIEQFSDVGAVLGIPLDSQAFLAGFGFLHLFGHPGGVFFILIADESVTTGGVVIISRDLQGLDGSVFFWEF